MKQSDAKIVVPTTTAKSPSRAGVTDKRPTLSKPNTVAVTMAQSMRAAFRASHRTILMIDAAVDSDRDEMTSGLPPASSQDGKDASLKFPNENSSAR